LGAFFINQKILLKSKKRYIIFLAITIIGYILVEYIRPTPTNWKASYSNKDRIPYGCEVLYKILPELFHNQIVTDKKFPLFAVKEQKMPAKSNYLYVYSFFDVDSVNTQKLLNYVSEGNNAFIAAEQFSSLQDTLHFKTSYMDIFESDSTKKDVTAFLRDSSGVNLVNPKFHQTLKYPMKGGSDNTYFQTNDTTQATILGVNGSGKVNFLKIPFGKGFFYLNTTPLAFTNYYLLKKKNADYVIQALSYLPDYQIFWAEYVYRRGFASKGRFSHKPHEGRGGTGEDDEYENSPLKYIISQPPLKWAYFLMIFGLLAYVLFEGKRRQRIIPIIETPRNSSLEFVETIGQLYFTQQNHKDISEKKISYFLTFIRNKFFLKTKEFDADFKNDLAAKSGVELSEVNQLFDYIIYVQNQSYLSENQLLQLNQKIENFQKQI
jgi:hypothetical protein